MFSNVKGLHSRKVSLFALYQYLLNDMDTIKK